MMKKIKSIVIILITTISSINSFSQSLSCCSKVNSTETFAMLANNSSFVSAHESPLPFDYISDNGHMITFKTSDGKDGNAFELKAAKSSKKYILMVHEWWGLNDYIKQEAEKLYNELGDVNVIAIDLYDGKKATVADSASKYMQATKTERAEALIKGIYDYMGSDVKIATIGWCFGGGWSLQSAIMAGNKANACVMYYGMPEKDLTKLKKLNAEVLGIFAGKDKWITNEIVNEFQRNMKLLKKKITVKTFDADHAFANPSNPHYNKPFAEEAHQMVLAFFRKQLK